MKGNIIKFPAVFYLLLWLTACSNDNLQSSVNKIEAVGIRETRISTLDANSAEPNLASAPDGSIYLVWVEHGANKTADVFLQHFNGDGKSLGEKVRVNPRQGQATAWFGDAPTVIISGDGTIYVGWTAKVDAPKGNANNLYLSVSRNGGRTFDTPVKVNDDTKPASHGMHSLAVDKENRVYLAWLDERNLKFIEHVESSDNQEISPSISGFKYVKVHHNSNQESKNDKKESKKESVEPNSEIFYAVSKDGGKTFSPNKKLSGEVCPCCKTNLLIANDGKVFVSWRQVLEGDFRHIAVASLTDGGENFSKSVIVSDDKWQINACPVSGAAMSIDKNNTLKIVWYTAGKAGIAGLYEAESKADSRVFSSRALIFEGAVTGTPVFLSGEEGSFAAVWESNGKLFRAQSQNNQNVPNAIINGNLPSAVFVGKKLFVAFIRKEGENQTIWLAEI